MNNALSNSKYGWKNVCKLWLQERTPYPLRFTTYGSKFTLCSMRSALYEMLR